MILGKDPDKFFKNFFSAARAQAFLLAGGDKELEELLVRYLNCESRSFCKRCPACESGPSLDVKRYEGELLKIEEAREILRMSNQSSLSGPKIFLIKTDFIAPEAQGTLLKTIEEPHPDTYFIISLPSEAFLSAPLLSRLTTLRSGLTKISKDKKELKFTLEAVSLLAKDRPEAERTFRRLEWWVRDKIESSSPENLPRLGEFLEDLFEAKRRFFEKTYPPRMLLEHLILSKYYLEQ